MGRQYHFTHPGGAGTIACAALPETTMRQRQSRTRLPATPDVHERRSRLATPQNSSSELVFIA